MTHFVMNNAESPASVARLILFICMQLQSDADTMRQEHCGLFDTRMDYDLT